ncbi:MAG: hypothetical protein WC900_00310 [Oscillospiraceae bacterium]|jgi:hypothetical protein
MQDYRKQYYLLFNNISESIVALKKVTEPLIIAQQNAELLFVADEKNFPEDE